MALPDVNFTNNVGAVTFKRCLVDVSDEWQWNGRAVTRRKRVTIDGWITRDTSEAIEGIQTQVGDGPSKGFLGTLTLPWTVLNGIKIESINMELAGWQDMVHVQASFLDDLPSNNIYTLSFYGLVLHNPRLALPIPAKNTYDYYVQMPMTLPSGASGVIGPSNPFYAPIRFRTGYGMMTIQLSGSLSLPEGPLPTDLIDKLTKRMGVGDGAVGDSGNLPDGFPCIFKLGEAIPELAGDIAMTSVFVAGGQIAWTVEKQIARITLRMRTQPQAWPGVPR